MDAIRPTGGPRAGLLRRGAPRAPAPAHAGDPGASDHPTTHPALEEKLEEYRSVLPEEDRKRLEEEIEVLKQDPKGISREQWEALEEMEKRLDTAAQRSENRMQEIASQVTEALALARQAAEESDNPDEKTKPTEGGVGQSGEQMEKALSEQLAKLAAAGDKAPSREVSEAMRDALAQMKAADAKEAAKALSALKAKLAEMPGGT